MADNEKGKEKDLDLENEDWDNEEDADGQDGKGAAGGKNKQQQNTGRQFSQEYVTKALEREKTRARDAALKELGIDPKNPKASEAIKAFLASQKTDVETATEQLNEQTSKVAEIELRARTAEAKAAIMQQGIKTQYVDDAVVLIMAKATDDTDDKGFATAVGELKTKYPVWFDEEDDADDKGKKGVGTKGKDGKQQKDKEKEKDTGKKGTGSSVKATGDKGDKEEQGLGARLAAQRKNGAAKSHYWGNKDRK